MPVALVDIWMIVVGVSVCACTCHSLKIAVLIDADFDQHHKIPEELNKIAEGSCFDVPESFRDELQIVWTYINNTSVLSMSLTVCDLVKEGIYGLVSVLGCRSQRHLSAQANSLHLPHLIVSTEPCQCQPNKSYSLHVSPGHHVKNELLKDILIYIGWTSVGFIFDESIGQIERRDAVFALSSIQVESLVVSLKSSANESSVIQRLRLLQRETIKEIVLWAQRHTLQSVCAQASKLQMLNNKYSWVIFVRGLSLQTASDIFRTCSAANAVFVSQSSDESSCLKCFPHIYTLDGKHKEMLTSLTTSIVMFQTIAAVVKQDENDTLDNFKCFTNEPYISSLGQNLLSELKQIWSARYTNFSGFDDSGFPRSAEYNMYSSTRNTSDPLVLVGKWSSKYRLNIMDDLGLFINKFTDFKNQLIKVTAKQELPFVVRLHNGSAWSYTGLSFDVLDELSERLHFRYTVIDPEDRRYGAPNDDNGTWNGMVGMVKRKEVLMAIGPFSITSLRDTVIDYTKPYMDDSIGILSRKPQADSNLFQMMRPFATEVWIGIAVVILVGGVMLTVINRLTPYGSEQVEDRSWVDDERSFRDNLWVIYIAVLEQGAVYFPKANSSRCVLGFWWVFTILIVSTYTANLAAFLTVSDSPPTVNTLSELLQQEDLGILVQDGSNLWSMFKDSDYDIYQEVWRRLHNSPTVDGLDAALPYVRTGRYAYIGDKSTLEYVAAQQCQTFVVADESFNAGTYGFVMPEDSPFKAIMDFYIMKMLEAGLIDNWRQKWWARNNNCTKQVRTGSAKSLGLNTLGGVFIVYGFVALAAIVVLLAGLVTSTNQFKNKGKKCLERKQEQ